ncbi:MAG: ABC transporter substrate-binding protein [Vicingaceae bacterium]
MCKPFPTFFSALLFCFLFACQPDNKKPSKSIRIHQVAEAKDLNPVTCRDEFSNYLSIQIFQPLLAFDFESEEIVPVLAEELPSIEKLDSNRLAIQYQIRPEAKFASGRQILAQDVFFALKAHLCPGVNSYSTQFFRFIKAFKIDPNNALSFTLVCENMGNATLYYSGAFQLLDPEVYDPNHYLENCSLASLTAAEASADSNLMAFSKAFNAVKYSKEIAHIQGSGPYELKAWEEGQKVSLAKKADWWGNKFQNENSYFKAFAQQLEYRIISDENTAFLAFQKGALEFSAHLGLQQAQKLDQAAFQSVRQEESNFQYLGFNVKANSLKHNEVRRALMHCLPRELILEKVFHQLGSLTSAPLRASEYQALFPDTTIYQFNPKKAKALLLSNGWEDSNENGILDRKAEGTRQELSLKYAYNSGNEKRKAVGLILKQEALKAGIEIEIETFDWSTYLNKMRNGELEIFYNSTSTNLLPADLSQLIRTNGQNYFNYYHPKVDSLVQAIRYEERSKPREKMLLECIEQIHEDMPAVFLFSTQKRMWFKHNLDGIYSAVRPHYWAPAFQLEQP